MGDQKQKKFGIERFYKKVFSLVLGSILMTIPFYAAGLKMLLLTEKESDWMGIHTVFFCVGLLLFLGGIWLNRLAELAIKILTFFVDRLSKK